MEKGFDKKYVFLVTFVFAFLFALATRWVFLGDYLVGDDTTYLPKALLGFDTKAGWNQFRLIDAVSVFGSISAVKFIPLAAFAFNSALITLIFLVYTKSLKPVLAVLLGLAITTVPLATDQIVFVTASHPTLSLSLMLFALFLFGLALYSSTPLYLCIIGLIAFALVGAAQLSPVGTLAPIALPIWVAIVWIAFRAQHDETPSSRHLLGLVIGVISASTYYIISYKAYHYSRLVGWAEFTPAQVVANLVNAVDRILAIYGPWHSSSVFILIAILLTIVLTTWVTSRSDQLSELHRSGEESSKNYLLILGFSALILSALSFGPGSIVTILRNRYLVAPLTLSLLSVAAFAFYLAPGLARNSSRLILSFALFGLVLINGLHAYSRVYEAHESKLATHLAIKQLVDEESAQWSDTAQIVILLTQPGYTSPTSGFNHWSTWYLRYLTGNSEIIGLLGYRHWVKADPFVTEYRDHDQEYWDHSGKRSRRIKMKGLEKNRPTFIYEQDKSGRFEAINHVIFGSPNRFHAVAFGDTFYSGKSKDLTSVCDETQPSSIYVWPATFPARNQNDAMMGRAFNNDIGNPENRLTLSHEFDGASTLSKTFDLLDGTPFRLELNLKSAVKNTIKENDKHNPPMPVLSPTVAFYQRNWSVLIHDRKLQQKWRVRADDSDLVEVVFQGIEGCVMLLSSDGRLLGSTGMPSVNGTWQFGRGFQQRFWQGHLDVNFSHGGD